jgi:nucleotide-binding universal stress UspA family protein
MANSEIALILLPVDGSESSVRAARHCATLARAFGSRVLLMNVQPEIADWQTRGIGQQAAEEHLNGLATAALESAAKVLADAGVGFESMVRFGDAPALIAQAVVERNCGAIVMGTRGQSELKSLIMGGVGMKVIHLVRVPITFVH